MNKIKIFLKEHNITSHTIAALISSTLVLLYSNQEARDLVIKTFITHPKIVATLFSIAGIYAKYSGGHSAMGVMQEVPKAIVELNKDVAKH